MTKEEMIELAREAGFERLGHTAEDWVCHLEDIERFAKLIAFAKRDKCKAQEQGPVAWGVFEGNLHDMFFSPSEAQEMADLQGTHAEVRPLYTHPLQRTWVGLTAKEKHEFRYSHMTTADFIEDIEAKLKEKNND